MKLLGSYVRPEAIIPKLCYPKGNAQVLTDEENEIVRRGNASSFPQIFALRRSETLDSRSKVMLKKTSSVDNFSLPSETDFVMSSISVCVALSTTFD